MHVSKSCLLLVLFAVGLLASAAQADPPACTRHCQGSACPASTGPECPYQGCCEECPRSCGQPCEFDCCEDDCCEFDCCPCPPECRGGCPPCPPAAYLPEAIRRALGYGSAKKTVRPASCSKFGCCTGCGDKAGCGCKCGCDKCTCGKAFKSADCGCNCGCDKCTCGKANKAAAGCPFAHVIVGRFQRGPGPIGAGPTGPPPAILHKMAQLIAENAVLKTKLELLTKHNDEQRELEQALMKARQQIAHITAKQQHGGTAQQQIMAQWIQMNAEQTARKDEVLVDLLSALVQMQAENNAGGGAATEKVIEKFEVKIERLERALEKVHHENAQLRARMAELIKARHNAQHRTKSDRVNRYHCGETSDVEVEIETIRRALNRPACNPQRDFGEDDECPGCPAGWPRR